MEETGTQLLTDYNATFNEDLEAWMDLILKEDILFLEFFHILRYLKLLTNLKYELSNNFKWQKVK